VEKVITVRLTAEEQAAVEKSAREVQDSIAKLNL
jgi:malate/lactate dehydrogenase